MVKPTLFVLAAGLGNKYGGMRQQESIGPNGETILDYTVFDACRADLGRLSLSFILLEKEFKEFVLSKYEGRIAVEYLIQDKKQCRSATRLKHRIPGVRSALCAGKDLLQTPFGIVNAEDFLWKREL